MMVKSTSLQKGSPYLADANYLWHMSFQMGLSFTDVERHYEHYFPNSTKCSDWSDVKRSHLGGDSTQKYFGSTFGL